jgi:hypothetical protein
VKNEARVFGTVNEWAARFPGSSRKVWLNRLIPELRAKGVMVKIGRKFVGRPDEVDAAIVAMGGGAL